MIQNHKNYSDITVYGVLPMSLPTIPPKKQSSDLHLCVEMDINAPIEIVFQVIANPQNFVELESVVQKVEVIGGHHGKGMITRWHIQDSNTGKNIINDEECTHYEPPYQFAYRVTAGERPYAGVHTLTQNPDGTTHIEFNEVWYYPTDAAIKKHIIDNMILNVKRMAENLSKSK